jgi:hypothetical protein
MEQMFFGAQIQLWQNWKSAGLPKSVRRLFGWRRSQKEPEGEVEEQEQYHLLPELKELEEDAEVPEGKKELAGKVEEPEGEEKELETEPEPSLSEPEPPLPGPDEEEREQEFQLMMEKLNSTLNRALERGQRRRRRR